MWKYTAEGQSAGGGTDGRRVGRRPLCRYKLKSLNEPFSVSHFDLFGPLSPHESPVFYLHFFTSALCGKGWLEGYNLEETWDPITDTNIQSPHAALSPPVSHIMVTAAGLCLLGTRHPACLSHSGSQLQFLRY